MSAGTDWNFWLAMATVVAVLVGPVIAVVITRKVDDWRDDHTRRMEIFRTLMRTRKMPIHYEHVGALNLVEIEFSKDQKVIAAWRDYLRNLGEKLHPEADSNQSALFLKRREALLTKLIDEIARILRFRVEQLDILEGNYLPQGWNDDDWEQRVARRSLIAVLTGQRPILMQPYTPAVGPYPTAPQAQSQPQSVPANAKIAEEAK